MMDEDGFACSQPDECWVCQQKATFVLRVNEGSAEGGCKFRRDLCEEHWKALELRLMDLVRSLLFPPFK